MDLVQQCSVQTLEIVGLRVKLMKLLTIQQVGNGKVKMSRKVYGNRDASFTTTALFNMFRFISYKMYGLTERKRLLATCSTV